MKIDDDEVPVFSVVEFGVLGDVGTSMYETWCEMRESRRVKMT
jgi:hypothetical protein